eukprot:s7506_g3.t1
MDLKPRLNCLHERDCQRPVRRELVYHRKLMQDGLELVLMRQEASGELSHGERLYRPSWAGRRGHSLIRLRQARALGRLGLSFDPAMALPDTGPLRCSGLSLRALFRAVLPRPVDGSVPQGR